jgi:serine/threonine-protein kinase
MEYLSGLTLQELVDRHGPLPPERVVHLLRQVCGSLREAHSLGLIHRDIKPSNIMVCQRGGESDIIKVVDFGLVQGPASDDGGRLTQEGLLMGTPAYMSPEQAGGRSNLVPRTDVYSLGAVAYFLSTGAPPFRGETPMQTILAHLQEPVRPPSELNSNVPSDLEAVIMRCLEKDPSRRIDVDELDRSLAQCRSAADWTPQRAADWWRAHPLDDRAWVGPDDLTTYAHEHAAAT